jgi:hypothetical protein
MKYQVAYEVTLTGEMSIEADSPEEAKEIANEELDLIRVNNESSEVVSKDTDEPYEWDEAAKKRNIEYVKSIFDKAGI